MTPPQSIRAYYIDHLELLADPEAQLRYESDAPFIPIAVELYQQFYDNYDPGAEVFTAAFSQAEIRALADFERQLSSAAQDVPPEGVRSVSALHSVPSWRGIMRSAQELHRQLKFNRERLPTA